MATWDDVRRAALGLPGTEERSGRDGLLAWLVKDKTFVWERPLRRSDREALGDAAPDGPILGARSSHASTTSSVRSGTAIRSSCTRIAG